MVRSHIKISYATYKKESKTLGGVPREIISKRHIQEIDETKIIFYNTMRDRFKTQYQRTGNESDNIDSPKFSKKNKKIVEKAGGQE